MATVRGGLEARLPLSSQGPLRHAAFDSTGRLWVAVINEDDNRLEMWSSTDGSTFTEATSLRQPVGSTDRYPALAIDRTTDRAVFSVQSNLSASPDMWMAAPISPTATWTELSVSGAARMWWGDMVTFTKPSSTNFFVATVGASYQSSSGAYRPVLSVDEYTAAGVFVTQAAVNIPTATTSNQPLCALDFRHTGDGSTVAASSPDLFVTVHNDVAVNVKFMKHTWTGSGWSAGTWRTISTTTGVDRAGAAFDGTRLLMLFPESGSVLRLAERDAGDTATTIRTLPASPGGAVVGYAVTADSAGNPIVHASFNTAYDIHRTRFDRATGMWDAWATVATTTVYQGSVHNTRGWASGKGVAVTWNTDQGGGDFNVEAVTEAINNPPTAPTWNTPAENSAHDIGASLLLDWMFNDPDAGDSQSAYALQRVVNGGSVEWWTGSTWGTETKITTSTTSLTLPSSWGSDTDEWVLKVKVWDQADEVSPLSAPLTIVASEPVTPTLDSPATDGTVVVSNPTVEWTVTEQAAYRLRVLDDADTQLFSTGKISDTDTRTRLLGFTLDDGLTDLKFELTTWNNEDLPATVVNTGVDVDYVAPATPTLTVTADDAAGNIQVTITDPTPTGGQPTVVSHDVHVRVAAGGRQDGERTVGGGGIRIAAGITDGEFVDWAAAAGVDYEYRAEAIADNDTSTFSAWT